MEQPKSHSSKRIYLSIVGIVAAIVLSLGLLGTLITYPTQQHRDVEKQKQETQRHKKATVTTITYASSDNSDLSNTNEARYTALTKNIFAVVQLILSFVVVRYVYYYLRKNSVAPTNRAWGATTMTVVAGNYIGDVLLLVPTYLIIGLPLQLYDILDPFSLGTIFIAMALSFALTFFFAWISELLYDRQHKVL